MSGPRISTGTDSKQDYRTPVELIAAVEKRFGPIVFDLAAHAGNAQHARYFAPAKLAMTITPEMLRAAVVETLVKQGAHAVEVEAAVDGAVWVTKKDKTTAEISVANHDPAAAAFDSLSQSWHQTRGLQWLNPEFGDIATWAEKCAAEAALGAEIALHVPAAVGASWFRDHVAPHALTNLLNGRLSYDGKNVFPKDCIVSIYRDGVVGVQVWDWRNDVMHSSWTSRTPKRGKAA